MENLSRDLEPMLSRRGWSIGRRWLSSKGNELVKVETMGRIRLIGLNRPGKRNAVNNDMANRLLEAFESFDRFILSIHV